ncbi:MAG: Flp pilus assembly complex ATPase component TadA, partial [Clostridia bacterium]|nr:Flp pilus assembly complex ATPase component TadA [Clostridia bacterium]
MKQGIASFLSEKEKIEFVKKEDAAFEKRLDEAISGIMNNANVRVILLSGPSGSGKTTASEKISKKFAEFGKRLVFVAIDDFYLDKEENARRAAAEGRVAEHESVKSID